MTKVSSLGGKLVSAIVYRGCACVHSLEFRGVVSSEVSSIMETSIGASGTVRSRGGDYERLHCISISLSCPLSSEGL